MENARPLLDPLFREAQAAFVDAGFPRVKRVRLFVTEEVRDNRRHFAACRTDGLEMLVAPELVLLDVDSAAAVIAHEFGHAVDFLYPGRFLLVDGKLHEWTHPDWSKGAAEPHARFAQNRVRQWTSRSSDAVERTADAIAEHAMGRPISYGGDCMIQTFDHGIRPRPAGLR